MLSGTSVVSIDQGSIQGWVIGLLHSDWPGGGNRCVWASGGEKGDFLLHSLA